VVKAKKKKKQADYLMIAQSSMCSSAAAMPGQSRRIWETRSWSISRSSRRKTVREGGGVSLVMISWTTQCISLKRQDLSTVDLLAIALERIAWKRKDAFK